MGTGSVVLNLCNGLRCRRCMHEYTACEGKGTRTCLASSDAGQGSDRAVNLFLYGSTYTYNVLVLVHLQRVASTRHYAHR